MNRQKKNCKKLVAYIRVQQALTCTNSNTPLLARTTFKGFSILGIIINPLLQEETVLYLRKELNALLSIKKLSNYLRVLILFSNTD